MHLYQSILVGIDFSAVSQAALFQAARLSARSRAALRAVHVIDDALVQGLANAGGSGGVGNRDVLLEDFRRRLAGFVETGAPDAVIDLEVAVDSRTSGFLRIAEDRHTDLLIVGDPDDDRVGIGQLPKACIQQTQADVLLVRDNGIRPFRKILAAIDLSPDSAPVLQRAAYMAAGEGAELVIAYVHEAPWSETLACRLFGDGGSQQRHERENIIQSRLAEIAKPWLEEVPGERIFYHVELDDEHRSRIGDLGDELLADLIVVGVRPQGLLGDLLSISTCQRAIEDSLSSVLAVTARAADASPTAS